MKETKGEKLRLGKPKRGESANPRELRALHQSHVIGERTKTGELPRCGNRHRSCGALEFRIKVTADRDAS